MLQNKKILTVIPARGGSKGLPGKNVKTLIDKPLIAWTIELANRCEFIDRVVVSTDDTDIAEVAKAHGADVPFMRPAELATDSAPTKDALVHCVNALDENYDVLVLLQPTSPLRTLETLQTGIELSVQENASVVSVSESAKPIEWMFYRAEKGIEYVTQEHPRPTRRQECKPVYYVDGCVYVMPISDLLAGKPIFDENALTVVSQSGEAVDIDTIKDFEFCEFLLKGK
ncbi:acylneuraminate cytidylyltransferase family protein [Alteromonas sp. a30]|uniref:acylneuraminate cytidylyltransferase family protein n=1 Tax=Alteromonas sp. a30 TaxID=2730917 RepID=UPI0022816095|nr:acylneuraminate cytidylyltransferase family protein [Alteromonas sp. a30]MCY7294356.1 acylneuraminate cytidylyltransferase family protein [Alteromonas sp. a30]